MTKDNKNILQKIAAGKVEMSRFETMLDDINAEQAAFIEDQWLSAMPYTHLVNEAIANNIAERRAAIEWKFKSAAISVWCYLTEAKRMGLLSPSGQAVPQAPRPRDDEDPEDDPDYRGKL